jgi:hypothetical protein
VKILSHRGYWRNPAEKNQPAAFRHSFELGFGTETDLRDHCGQLVIAHDMPDGSEPGLAEVLAILAGRDLPLALNIKADGLAPMVREALQTAGLQNWFTFDMSVPDLLQHLALGLPAFTRASEHEQPPPLLDRAPGVWVDAFERDWYTEADLRALLSARKAVCLVSPELHRRDPQPLWRMLRQSGLAAHPDLMLCTDMPEDAARCLLETA